MIADILYDNYGLAGLNPHTLSKLTEGLMSNRTITDIMLMGDSW